MVDTNDGFEIAEVDLQLRGPGDISGTQQSGVLEMKIANLTSDQAILSEARQAVIAIFQEDPALVREENGLLLAYLDQRSPGISWDKIS
jgi:ATP-dependent DNA helicase RecG